MRTGRGGVALAIVLGVLFILAAFATVLRLLTHSAYREVDQVNAHMQAVAIGEVAFGATVARLSSAPWANRWFRAGPVVETDVPTRHGRYTLLIGDTSQPASFDDPLSQASLGSPNQADVLIRATFEKTSVLMYWRLTVPEDSLDALATVIPAYFALGPESAPVSPGTAGALAQLATAALRQRAANTPRVEKLGIPLQQATSAQAIGTLLGFAPGAVVEPPAVAAQPGPPGAGAPELPPLPAPPVPTLEGNWIGDSFPEYCNGVTEILTDHVVMHQTGNLVTGTCKTTTRSGQLQGSWSFSTTFDGTNLAFDPVNFVVTMGGSALWHKVMRLDPSGQRLSGTTYVSDGKNYPTGYTRAP